MTLRFGNQLIKLLPLLSCSTILVNRWAILYPFQRAPVSGGAAFIKQARAPEQHRAGADGRHNLCLLSAFGDPVNDQGVVNLLTRPPPTRHHHDVDVRAIAEGIVRDDAQTAGRCDGALVLGDQKHLEWRWLFFGKVPRSIEERQLSASARSVADLCAPWYALGRGSSFFS